MSTDLTTSPAAVLDCLLTERWSCRAFTGAAVPVATIEEIVRSAGRSPSWCNTQPWHLHVLSGPAVTRLREALQVAIADGPAECADIAFPPSYDGVYADRRRRAGWQLYDALGVEKGDRAASAREMMKNFSFFGAPHVAIVTTTASLGTYGAVDCGLFVQSFLLAAQARGVGAVPQAALASQAPVIREQLGLDDDRQVLIGISFGFPDLEHPANGYRTERQDLRDVATWVND